MKDKQYKYYNLDYKKTRYFKKNVAKEVIFEVKFREKWKGTYLKDLSKELRKMFKNVLQQGTRNYYEDDIGRIYINHNDLTTPITVTPRKLSDLTPSVIMS